MKNKNEIEIFLLSFLFQLTGWVILFIISWKIAIGIAFILFGQKIKNDLIIDTIIKTIENILLSLGSLIHRENPIDGNGEIKKN